MARRYSIGVLTDPSDEAIDVGLEPWEAALAMTKTVWESASDPKSATPPTRPSGKKIREMRESLGGDLNRGVLLIYPLSPVSKDKEGGTETLIVDTWEKPIIAFAMAFPTSENGVKVEYKVDLLYWEQEYGPSE